MILNFVKLYCVSVDSFPNSKDKCSILKCKLFSKNCKKRQTTRKHSLQSNFVCKQVLKKYVMHEVDVFLNHLPNVFLNSYPNFTEITQDQSINQQYFYTAFQHSQSSQNGF